jgi:hypothetical protein
MLSDNCGSFRFSSTRKPIRQELRIALQQLRTGAPGSFRKIGGRLLPSYRTAASEALQRSAPGLVQFAAAEVGVLSISIAELWFCVLFEWRGPPD